LHCPDITVIIITIIIIIIINEFHRDASLAKLQGRLLAAYDVSSNAGNDNLHLLTFFKRQVLRIELGDWEGHKRYAKYDNFRVGSEHMQYKLISAGNYRGNAGQYDIIVDMADVAIDLTSIFYFITEYRIT